MGRVSEIARRLVPAVCDISVTDICNATCDFCSFARDKDVVHDRRGSIGVVWRRHCRFFIGAASVTSTSRAASP